MTKPAGTYRQIKITAAIENVSGEGYSWDADTVAQLETTIRLEGHFDRSAVADLVTGIVNQLTYAYDKGLDVKAEAPDEEAAEPRSLPSLVEQPDQP